LAHQTDERIRIAEVGAVADIYIQYILSLKQEVYTDE